MRSNSFEAETGNKKIGISKIDKPIEVDSSKPSTLEKKFMKSYQKIEAFLRENCS